MMVDLEFFAELSHADECRQRTPAAFRMLVLSIDDSMESIFETIKDTALIHKSGGVQASVLKAARQNSPVKSTGGISSGPVSFMKVFMPATQAVKQGGNPPRRQHGDLKGGHPDILEFITCKRDDKEITNFNISVAVTEDFINKALKGEDYELIDPRSKKAGEQA